MVAREPVVIGGKGGTGKTSIVGSFASLAERLVPADCDVDAPGHCTTCGKCEELCRFDADGVLGEKQAADGQPTADRRNPKGAAEIVRRVQAVSQVRRAPSRRLRADLARRAPRR